MVGPVQTQYVIGRHGHGFGASASVGALKLMLRPQKVALQAHPPLGRDPGDPGLDRLLVPSVLLR